MRRESCEAAKNTNARKETVAIHSSAVHNNKMHIPKAHRVQILPSVAFGALLPRIFILCTPSVCKKCMKIPCGIAAVNSNEINVDLLAIFIYIKARKVVIS